MRYKIVKMTEEEKNKFHPCELCDCAREAFCLYPGECTAGDDEYIKKVYK